MASPSITDNAGLNPSFLRPTIDGLSAPEATAHPPPHTGTLMHPAMVYDVSS